MGAAHLRQDRGTWPGARAAPGGGDGGTAPGAAQALESGVAIFLCIIGFAIFMPDAFCASAR